MAKPVTLRQIGAVAQPAAARRDARAGDAFHALRNSISKGSLASVRNLERLMEEASGETSAGVSLMRVDGGSPGAAEHRQIKRGRAAADRDQLLDKCGPGSRRLMVALLIRDGGVGDWRSKVRKVTGVDNPAIQADRVVAASDDLRDAHTSLGYDVDQLLTD